MKTARRLLLVVVALGVAAGLALLAYARADPLGFADHKRELRLALGLPKLWATQFNTDPTGYESAPCPAGALVIVTGGQSNSANALADPLPVDPSAQAFMFHSGTCYRLRDPVLGASIAPADGSGGGSLWTALGTALYRKTGKPVVFINGGVGGTQLGDWLDDRSGYFRRLLANVAAARRQGLVPAYVLWVQGETDATALLPPAEFTRQIEALIAKTDGTGLVPKRAPWVVYRSTYCLDRRGNGPDIDAAVTALAAGSDRIILGPAASDLDDSQRRDGCHFNALGRETLTADVMAIMAPRLGAP
jgi:hypothetical protein